MLRRQAHDLQKAEKQFRAVLEAAPEAMIITDDRERISLLNSQTEKLFNIQRSELLGKPVNLILPE